MNLLEPFLETTTPGKISQIHLYCDNYFTNLDLLVHLKKLGLRCTGTIRENQENEKNVLNKTSSWGKYAVKNESNSRINYITVVDSKPVSVASTATGVTPPLPSKRYSTERNSRIEIPFAGHSTFIINSWEELMFTMGTAINVLPSIRSKKWTCLNQNGPHEISRQSKQAQCSDCSITTYKFSDTCQLYFCSAYMKKKHDLT